MSSLDRLRELVRGTGDRRQADARPALPACGERVAARGDYETPRRELTYEPVDASGRSFDVRIDLPAIDGAMFLETALGRVLAVDRIVEAEAWHGRVRVDRSEVTPADLPILLEPARGARPGAVRDSSGFASLPVLFLDLETTGLSGGAGTVAFLVGCGWFEAGAFRTRQFLLPGFGGERAMLSAVATLLEACGGLVTYNGKTFDLPVMETRWLFQRMTPPWDVLPHVDLLHLARRLWARREDDGVRLDEPGCRLVSLERTLLGFGRIGDVNGFEIPSRYFDFVRYGDARVLLPVLQHNQLDLLSLGCLTARAVRLLREGVEAAMDGPELVALGREYARRGDEGAAQACFRHALERADVASELRGDALYGLARLLRRHRRHAEAAPLWHELARTTCVRSPLTSEAREALAVHYEHRDRNLDLASHWARQIETGPTSRRRHEETSKRLARIGRKIAVRRSRMEMGALPLDA